MPKLLLEVNMWDSMKDLLIDLLYFMEPWLRAAQLSAPIKLLYQGILRILLVLLHDFPEFLCEFHLSFCDIIPPTCIQLRNLILSAFPHSMKLPDPFIPNLKVDLLPEIKETPQIRSNYVDALIESGLKTPLDAFLRNCSPPEFLISLPMKLVFAQYENADSHAQILTHGTKYNVPLMNSLVSYLGICALPDHPMNECSPQAPMEIFAFLAINLDTEGRYLLFNSIANQLRYPNNQTHYFSCVLLYLFAESTSELIQEQITRYVKTTKTLRQRKGTKFEAKDG